MFKGLARIVIFLASIVLAMSFSYAYIADSTNYTIDSVHTGLSGGNAYTATYSFRSTTTYEQPVIQNATTTNYSFNSGWLSSYVSLCGNGIPEYGESCDAGINNGACPSVCSVTCTINSCGSSDDDDDDDDDGGGGGGGGSGLNLALNQASGLSLDITMQKIVFLTGENRSVDFSNSNSPLRKIDFATTAANSSSLFKVLVSRTSSITYPDSIVYVYINVSHDSLSEQDISNVKIYFKVEKSWITSNKLLKPDITLLRYDGSWTALPVKFVSEDSTSMYFEATSPGLSLFAVSRKPVASSNTAVPSNATTPASTNNELTGAATKNTSAIKNTPAKTVAGAKSDSLGATPHIWLYIFIIPIIVAGLLIGVVLLRKYNAKREILKKMEEWIDRQEQRGYTDAQLEGYLRQLGYANDLIGEAILEHSKMRK